MELCWNQDATQRPSAKDILTTSHMMSADFLAQHKHFPRELEEVDFVTSVTEVNQQPYRHKFSYNHKFSCLSGRAQKNISNILHCVHDKPFHKPLYKFNYLLRFN